MSPDAGGAERARAYAKRLDAELAIIDKRRSDDGTAEVMNVVGDVGGRTCILQDDIIDTAGTIVKAANALKANGAERVFACAVHGVLSGPAIERLEAAPLDQVIITNTIPLSIAPSAARRSSSSRSHGCWVRRFGVFTRRHRSRRCLCKAESSASAEPELAAGTMKLELEETEMDATLQVEKRTDGARTRRGACGRPGGFRRSSTGSRRARRSRLRSTRSCCCGSSTPTPA